MPATPEHDYQRLPNEKDAFSATARRAPLVAPMVLPVDVSLLYCLPVSMLLFLVTAIALIIRDSDRPVMHLRRIAFWTGANNLRYLWRADFAEPMKPQRRFCNGGDGT